MGIRKAILLSVILLFSALFILTNCDSVAPSDTVTQKTWEQIIKLLAPDAGQADYFGNSVAISGDYVIIAAYANNGDPFNNAGAAYIYHRAGDNSWEFVTKIMAPDTEEMDRFGGSVSICGDYAIVGAYGEDGGEGDPKDSAGAAYIYHLTDEVIWEFVIKVMAEDAQAGDLFGQSVAISSSYAIVGAPYKDGGDGDPIVMAGAAYIY